MSELGNLCPNCGYDDGFHVSYVPDENGMRIINICPDCHSRFDPGWVIGKD